MHPSLNISDRDVTVLRHAGVTSTTKVREVLNKVLEHKRKKEPIPENLNHLAGLCQRASVNQGAFKTMIRLQLKEAEEHPTHHGNVVAG